MTAAPLRTSHVVLEIDGEELTDLYPSVSRVEVELDDDLASLVRIELWLRRERDGTWTHVDDERLVPWRTITVRAGFADGTEPLVSGYLTHVHPTFDADPSRCRLELWGMDRSVVLDRAERVRDWPDRRDSEIAREIFAEHGLTARVEDTPVTRDATLSTVIQRETDMAFLRRLARRNGFECYVEGDEGHFHPPPSAPALQPLLAVHAQEMTNVDWLMLQVDGLAGTAVGAAGMHRTDKTVLTANAQEGSRPALGARTAGKLTPPGLVSAHTVLGGDVAVDEAELQALCQVAVDRSGWFVTGEGVLDGSRYGAVLRPRRPVTITGVGETHSGTYQVTHVTHTLGHAGYEQHFRVRRDGIGLTGTENFGTPGVPGGLR